MGDGTGEPLSVEELEARVRELEHERTRLLAVVEILQEISGTLHFVDILQTITRKLGETFGLDRCSIFLAERGARTARLVASYEDPSIRNYLVDLERYPELRRALASGETVFIPDAKDDPALKHIRGTLENRRVKSITVVPIRWRTAVIGAIFLRTFRDGPAFSDADIRFVSVVAGLAATALRNAYRFDRLMRQRGVAAGRHPPAGLKRLALVQYLRRLLEVYTRGDGAWTEGHLPRSSAEELERLVEITMAVLAEEAKSE